MKSSTVWHEHFTRPSLPAGTARKASGHLSGRGPSILLRKTVRSLKSPTGAFVAAQTRACLGRQSRLIMQTTKNRKFPLGELPVVHIAIVCGFNRKFYKQCNSQQLVCDMQFTVVANESNRELRWQGASYSGAHPVFVFMETHAVPYATSGSFLRTPSAVVSYKTCPANLARTS